MQNLILKSTFEITKVSNIKSVADNKITAKVTGNYTMHGVSKEVTADATLTYLDESEQTKMQVLLEIYLECRQNLI